MSKTNEAGLKPSERYARMTREEYRTVARRIEAEDPVGEPIPDAEWKAMKRAAVAERKRRAGGARAGAGRKPKPPGEKAARVLLTIDPKLLAAIDAIAAEKGTPRATLITQTLRKALKIG